MDAEPKISRRTLLEGFCALPAFAQEKPTFSADVKVVNILATVRDKQGQIVRDLTKDDFVLEEDGQPQTIRYFSKESDLPLTLGLLVDTSPSQGRLISEERGASYRFFDQVLREDRDSAFVIHFEGEVELLQDLTSSRQRLEKALDLLEDNQRPQRPQWGQRGGGRGRGGRGGRGGTALYDAVLLASDDLMRKQTGRKALVMLTDGVDTASKVPLEEGVESAQRADTLVFSVLFADPEMYGGGFGGFGGRGMGRRGRVYDAPDGARVLKQISRETGGRFFEVSRKKPIGQVYAEIEEDLRNQYSIGYTPASGGAGYRKIRLTTKQKNLIVQTREGYYAT